MASPFRPATELLTQYARYHRDRRNIAIHQFGIPLIVVAIAVLLTRPALPLAGVVLTPICVVWVLTTGWYLTRGNLLLGVAVSVFTALLVAVAHLLAAGSVEHWLGWGIGLFVVGWIVQAAGHYFEGRKPAFLDDIIGLLVGPMFVTAELLYALGWGTALKAEIERVAGPTVIRDLHKS